MTSGVELVLELLMCLDVVVMVLVLEAADSLGLLLCYIRSRMV